MDIQQQVDHLEELTASWYVTAGSLDHDGPIGRRDDARSLSSLLAQGGR